MKFKMNNRDWEIIELSQDEIRQHLKDYKYDGDPQEGKYFGQTYMDEQKIYLDKDLHIQQKKQTLMHELMHCYIGCFLFENGKEHYTEEDICNISANAHDIIHEIVTKYFPEKEYTKITYIDGSSFYKNVTTDNGIPI